MQIWKVPAAGGPAVQVTKQGGFEGFESPDGKYLCYLKGRGIPGIWRIPTEGGEEVLVTDHHRAGFWRYWRVADQGIYFATAATPARPLLELFNSATGQVSEVARLVIAPDRDTPGLAVSPDGRYILYAQKDRSGSEIMMVENFR
jgi:Tol biopolymer transport system component